MDAWYGPRSAQAELILMLLGEKESGKSSAGNAILCRRTFDTKTTRSCKKKGTIFGLQVTVVDTPGWQSQSTTPHRVSWELLRGLKLCHPGPHAILLVLPAFKVFGQEEWIAMEAQLSLLKTPIWQRALVLFTHGEKLGLPIQENIRRQGRTLQWLLERCENRYQVITSQSSTSQSHVQELFEKIQTMVEATKHPREIPYSWSIQPGQEGNVEGRRWYTRQEDIVMTEMDSVHNGCPDKGTATASLWPHLSRGGPGVLKAALSLILLGRRKSGKSSVGNMILGREEFQWDTKTKRCSAGQAQVSGWPVTVVDTPGWSLFGQADPEKVKKEILESPSLCPVRSKVKFLLVVPVDSFRGKDKRAVEMYLSVLGENVWRNVMVLFTYGEALEGKTVDSYIKKMGEPLEWVLNKCNHQHHVFDANMDGQTQVNQLLERVEKS